MRAGTLALSLLALVPLVAFAARNPGRYRRVYPALAQLVTSLLALLLGAHLALPALAVPVWAVYAAATLNALLFALLFLPLLRGPEHPRE